MLAAFSWVISTYDVETMVTDHCGLNILMLFPPESKKKTPPFYQLQLDKPQGVLIGLNHTLISALIYVCRWGWGFMIESEAHYV